MYISQNFIKKVLIFLFCFTITLFSVEFVYAQCKNSSFLDKCATGLQDYTFVKSYQMEASGKYSYVFSKGTNYRIVICDNNVKGGKMTVNLYDRNKKLIASSYDKRGKKYYPSINYTCAATGLYYIEYSFEGKKPGCGVNIIGFNNKKK